MIANSRERFSNRVDNYIKFRPTYPAETIDYIVTTAGLTSQSTIADIGSGTGKFTRLLLERKFRVLAVEPNKDMRAAAENELSHFENFTSIPADAENTTLSPHSVNLITVAQAFHWFNHTTCKTEFRRILKPNGYLAIIWNRRERTPGFMADYQNAIDRWHGDYPKEAMQRSAAAFTDFFDDYELHVSPNHQILSFEDLWGLTQSYSYSPPAGHPDQETLKNSLKKLFNQYSENNQIKFEHKTEVIIGKI